MTMTSGIRGTISRGSKHEWGAKASRELVVLDHKLRHVVCSPQAFGQAARQVVVLDAEGLQYSSTMA